MYKYEDIKTIHLEITQKCQASCPMCDRNINGGDVNPHLTMAELSLEDCQKIFNTEFIKQLTNMYMCGNSGDPIIAQDTLEVYEYFRHHNNNMRFSMNTNAGARDKYWWSELAKIINGNGVVRFSIDGLEDTNHIYRRNVRWDIIINSLTSFIEAGGNAVWDFLIFDHNEHQVEEAEELAKKLGVKQFVRKKTARFYNSVTPKFKDEHNIIDKKGKIVQTLNPSHRYISQIDKDVEDVLKKSNGDLTHFYDVSTIICKVQEEKSLYITAEGLVLPCCWIGSKMYKWYHPNYKVEQVWEFIKEKENVSALIHGLKPVLESGFFQEIENSWTKKSIKDGKLKVCSEKCSKGLDVFKGQYL